MFATLTTLAVGGALLGGTLSGLYLQGRGRIRPLGLRLLARNRTKPLTSSFSVGRRRTRPAGTRSVARLLANRSAARPVAPHSAARHLATVRPGQSRLVSRGRHRGSAAVLRRLVIRPTMWSQPNVEGRLTLTDGSQLTVGSGTR